MWGWPCKGNLHKFNKRLSTFHQASHSGELKEAQNAQRLGWNTYLQRGEQGGPARGKYLKLSMFMRFPSFSELFFRFLPYMGDGKA